MKRRRHTLQVSTFPFLAVLLCAMGSLILLLLVIDRRAKVAARAKALAAVQKIQEENAEAAAARKAELDRRQRELHAILANEDQELLGQIHSLEDRLKLATEDLEQEKLRTTEFQTKIATESAKVTEKLSALQSQQSEASRENQHSEASRNEVQRMRAQLEQLEQTLIDLKALRKRQQQMFSVVPYRGKSGENRRPIYVECARSGVVFHPDRTMLDGLTLSAGTIRTEVERRIDAQNAILKTSTGKPQEKAYLLMLIRPDGVITYGEALDALVGLPIDFGYELIESDWVLDFPSDESTFRTQPWMTANKGESPPAPPVAKSPVANATAPSPIRTPAQGVNMGTGSLPMDPRSTAVGSRQGPGNPMSGIGNPGNGVGPGVAHAPGFGPVNGTNGSGNGTGNGIPSLGAGSGNTGAVATTPRRITGFNAGPGNGNGPITGVPDGRGNGASFNGLNGSGIALGPPSKGGSGNGPHNTSSSGLPGAGSASPGMLGNQGGGNGIGPRSGSSNGLPGSTSGSGFAANSAPLGSGTPGQGYGAGQSGNAGNGTGNGATGMNGGGAPGNGIGTGSGNAVAGTGAPNNGTGGVPGNGVGTGLANTSGTPGMSTASPDGSWAPGLANAGTGIPGNGAGTGPGGSGLASMSDPTGTIGGAGMGASMSQGTDGGSTGSAIAAGSAGGPGASGSNGSNPGQSGPSNPSFEGGGAAPSGTPNSPIATANISNSFASSNVGSQGAGVSGGEPAGGPGDGSPAGAQGAGGGVPSLNVTLGNPPNGLAQTGSDGDSPTIQNSTGGLSSGGSPMSASGAGSPVARDPGETHVSPSAEPGTVSLPDPIARLMPRTAEKRPYRAPTTRPSWRNMNRDWVIPIECKADGVTVRINQQKFPIAALAKTKDSQLLKQVQQLIDKRQATVPEGDPPFRPIIRFQVWPDGLRSYYLAYPVLETLKVPMIRENQEPDTELKAIINR